MSINCGRLRISFDRELQKRRERYDFYSIFICDRVGFDLYCRRPAGRRGGRHREKDGDSSDCGRRHDRKPGNDAAGDSGIHDRGFWRLRGDRCRKCIRVYHMQHRVDRRTEPDHPSRRAGRSVLSCMEELLFLPRDRGDGDLRRDEKRIRTDDRHPAAGCICRLCLSECQAFFRRRERGRGGRGRGGFHPKAAFDSCRLCRAALCRGEPAGG